MDLLLKIYINIIYTFPIHFYFYFTFIYLFKQSITCGAMGLTDKLHNSKKLLI